MGHEINMNETFRNHPYMMIKRMWSGIWIVMVILLSAGDSVKGLVLKASGAGNILAAALLVLVLGLTGFVSWIGWYRITMSIDGMNFYWNRGGIFRKNISIPLQTISNCNLNQGLVEKLLGIYSVKLDVNSSKTAKNTDLNLVLDRDHAQELRELIFAGKTQKDSAPEHNPENVPTEGIISGTDETVFTSGVFKFGIKDVIRHAALQFSLLAILLFALGAFELFTDVFRGDSSKSGGGIMLILAAAVPAAYQGVAGITQLFDFRIQRIGGRLLLSYGLINNREYTLPVDKINAIQIQESLFARIAGYAMISVSNIGMGDEKKEKTNICLYMKMEECMYLIHELLPEYEVDFRVEKQEKNALVYYAVSRSIYILLPAVIASLILGIWWLVPAGAAAAASAAAANYITPGIKVEDRNVIIRKGYFTAVRWVIPYSHMEIMQICRNPLSDRLGIAYSIIRIRGQMIANRVETGMFRTELIERQAESFR